MSDKAVFRGALGEPIGITPEQRARNARMKDEAREEPGAQVRTGCDSSRHTEEQQRQRSAWIDTIKGHSAFGPLSREFLSEVACSTLKGWAEDVASGRTDEVMAAKARAKAARVDPVARAAALVQEVRERRAAEVDLDELARELYGVLDGDEEVYVDRHTGLQDIYRSAGNKMKARSAARIVAAQRADNEERTRQIREHQAEHRAAAQSVGLFGSLMLQLGRSKLRDEAGQGIFGRRGLRSKAPLPVQADGETPDPYARRIEQLRAAQAAKDAAREARHRRR